MKPKKTPKSSPSVPAGKQPEEIYSEPVSEIETHLDPKLQSAILDHRGAKELDPAVAFTSAEGTVVVEVLAKLADPSQIPAGLQVTSTIGQIVAGTVEVEKIEAVRAHPNVISLKAALPVQPHLKFSVPEIRASANALRQGLPAQTPAIRGRKVVVGIVDFGCDFHHQNFRTEGGTRLLSLWDQRGGSTAISPQPFNFGREFSKEQIDQALNSAKPYEALAYAPDDGDHGTHVMDIAAGNGEANGAPGVAPESDLIFVHLASNDYSTEQSFGNSKRLLQAVDYIFRKAGDRPCVVNLSLGTHGGPHDGTTLAEQGFDVLLKQPKRAIVLSAGNSYARRGHAMGKIEAAGTRRLRWEVGGGDPTDNELEIWYPGAARLALRLITPGGVTLGPVGVGATHVIRNGAGVEIGRMIHRATDPNNQSRQINVLLSRELAGIWTVELSNLGDSSADWHAWIERDDFGQSRFHADDADPTHTLGSISCGFSTIAVGSYSALVPSRELSTFTAAGPTRDGRQKPEVSAPGQNIQAARATTQGTIDMSGTSMASPHVTGLVALIYEAAARAGVSLGVDKLRGILRDFVRGGPPSGGGWDPRFGFGRVDAVRSIASQLPPASTAVVEASGAHATGDGAMPGLGTDFLTALLAGLSRAATESGARIRIEFEAEPVRADAPTATSRNA